MTQTNIPMNMIESVDVISGPGLGVTGVQAKESAGGVINLITKRAGAKDIMDYTTFFSGRSTWGNMIDISRRFADNAWGIRINTAYINGDTAIRDEKETQKNFPSILITKQITALPIFSLVIEIPIRKEPNDTTISPPTH